MTKQEQIAKVLKRIFLCGFNRARNSSDDFGSDEITQIDDWLYEQKDQIESIYNEWISVEDQEKLDENSLYMVAYQVTDHPGLSDEVFYSFVHSSADLDTLKTFFGAKVLGINGPFAHYTPPEKEEKS